MLKTVEKEPKIGIRKLAEFQCYNIQICTIYKKIKLKSFMSQMLAVHYLDFEKGNRQSEFSDINEAFYNWSASSIKNIFPDGIWERE